MKTTKEQAEQILSEIQKAVDARVRPMMGEYLVYVAETLTGHGQINRNQLFVKIISFGEKFVPELKRDSPYDGAKPAFIVPESLLNDADRLREFLSGTAAELSKK